MLDRMLILRGAATKKTKIQSVRMKPVLNLTKLVNFSVDDKSSK